MNEVYISKEKVYSYWLSKLSKAFDNDDLNGNSKQKIDLTGKRCSEKFRLSQSLFDKLSVKALNKDFNVFKIGLGSLGILFDQKTLTHPILIGSPAFNFDAVEETENALLFSEIEIGEKLTFRQLLKNIHSELQLNIEHQQYDFRKFATQRFKENRSIDRLLKVGFYFDSVNVGNKELDQFDIVFCISKNSKNENFDLLVDYNADVYDKTTVTSLTKQFAYILSVFCEDIEALVQDVDLGDLEESVVNDLLEFDSEENRIATNGDLKQHYYPLSSGQNRIFILHQFNEKQLAYNGPSLTCLDSQVSPELIKAALMTIVSRHDSLRTSFDLIDNEPFQIVHDEVEFEVELLEGIDQGEAMEKFIRPFDLSQAPLFRVGYLQSEDNPILLFDIHHIISDGVSQEILREELISILEGKILPKVELQYKDYISWLGEEQQQKNLMTQGKFWEEEFSSEMPLLELPYDYVRPENQTFNGGKLDFYLSTETTTQLRELAKSCGTTTYTVLLSAWMVLLSKLGNTNDLAVGTPVQGRRHPDLADIIGMFVNTIPVRAKLNPEVTFRQFVETIRESFIDVFENQEYPIEKLVAKVWDSKIKGRNPLFDTTFSLHNENEAAWETAPDFEKIHLYAEDFAAKFDLSLSTIEFNSFIKFTLIFNTDLFKPKTAEKFATYLRQLLSGLGQNSEVLLRDIDIALAEEQALITEVFNNTTHDYPDQASIPELFELQVQKYSTNTAIVFENKSWTYQELNEKADLLARQLSNQKADLVGIMVDRSEWAIIAILGILKTGAAYVPIEPSYPDARKQFMIKDSGISSLIICSDHLMDVTNLDIPVFAIDIQLEGISEKHETDDNTQPNPEPDDLAYIMYTSGSTGNPKGVEVSHRAILRLIYNQSFDFLNSSTVGYQNAPLAFDASTFEIWAPLLHGGRLVIGSSGEKSLKEIQTEIQETKVNTVWLTAGLFHLAVDTRISLFDGLSYVLAGGDSIQPTAVEKLLTTHSKCTFINGYGPTESTTFAITNRINSLDEIVYDYNIIGKPIGNTQAYIVDPETGRLLSPGLIGEIYLGGDGLARGYLNQPELSEDRFIEHPLGKGGRLYKTGDLGKFLEDGTIAFYGRKDFQLKIRGYRVEPGEIESVLAKVPTINQCVVVPKEDLDGNKYLVAFVVVQEDYDKENALSYLKNNLPKHMIPSVLMEIDQLPLTPNGKVDRKQFACEQVELQKTKNFVAATSETEKALVEIWSTILDEDQIGIEDNFFDLGGHSLLGIKLINIVERTFGVKLTISQLFNESTIKALAAIIDEADAVKFVPLEPAPELPHYPLSPAQSRMFIMQHFDKESLVYNIPFFSFFDTPYSIEEIKSAFTELMNRHACLRTSFEIIEGETVQVIHKGIEPIVEVCEGTDLQKVMSSFVRPFDLSEAPLFRIGYLKMENELALLFDIHHILTDELSQEVLKKDFAAILEGKPLPDTRIQYKDYVHWLNKDEQIKFIAEQEAYWLSVFDNPLATGDLPLDFPRPKIQSFQGMDASFNLSEEEEAILNDLCQQNQMTPYSVLLAIWTMLIAKLTDQDDVVVGTVVSGRGHPDLAEVVGMFVNTLALRNYPDSHKNIIDYLEEVKHNFSEAFEYQEYPFEHLVEKVWDGKIKNRNPIFDTTFSLLNRDDESDETEDRSDQIRFSDNIGGAKFDLALVAVDKGTKFDFVLGYSTLLFTQDTVRRIINGFRNIIRSLRSPDQLKIGAIGLLSSKEEQQIIAQFNNNNSADLQGKTAIDLFREQVTLHPGHRALVFDDQSLTYQELDDQSNQLATYLLKKGLKRGDLVAISPDRSLEMIIAILGILKSGGAYLPIDPGYPQERIDYILADAEIRMTIVATEHRTVYEQKADLEIVDLEKDRSLISAESTDLPRVTVTADSLMYVIYTSGSTGKPKGVLIEHGSYSNMALNLIRQFDVTKDDHILQFASISFDASVYEIFLALYSGATLVLIDQMNLLNTKLFTRYIKEQNVSIALFPPTFLAVLDIKELSSLRVISTGGEAANVKDAVAGAQLCDYYNLYGPTEASVITALYKVKVDDDERAEIPIGKPLSNTQILILNKDLQIQPINVEGEMYIGGKGLARAYLNKEVLTREKFIEHPFQKGKRLYKTGDRGKYLSDGNIVFVGRKDDQVKIRGYRIEKGEIEYALQQTSLVKQAVVLVREIGNGDRQLVAYVVPEGDFDKTKVLDKLSESLPFYMIPSLLIEIPEMPVNIHGKINKKALLDLDVSLQLIDEYVAPRTENEKTLADIWKEFLVVERIGILDNFFDLGGHSLIALKITNRINKAFNINLSLRNLFENPTIKQLTTYVETGEELTYEPIEKAPEAASYPLSAPQRRMFILQQLSKNSRAYNTPVIMPIGRDISTDKIKKCIAELVNRHEILRTSFDFNSEGFIQTVHEKVDFEIAILEEDSPNIALKKFSKPFQLKEAPLFSAGHLKTESQAYLILDIHHIITDEHTQEILGEELYTLFDNASLPEVPLQYKDFVSWTLLPKQQEALKKQKKYWLNKFSGELPSLDLPIDHARPEMQSFEGAYANFFFTKEEETIVRNLAKQFGTTNYCILLAAWSILLSKIGNQNDIVVGTPVSGRNHPDLENIVGMFVNTLPLRNFPEGQKNINDFIREVVQSFLEGLDNQSYPFEELVEALWDGTIKNRNPLFDTMFALVNFNPFEDKKESSKGTDIHFPDQTGAAQFDLSLTAIDYSNKMEFSLSFNTGLFERSTIERLLDYFRRIITAMKNADQLQIKDIDILSEKERTQLLAYNDTKEDYPKDKTIVALFEQQVAATPENFALITEDKILTYTQLNSLANQFSHYLIDRHNIELGDRVGIRLEKNELLYIAILGILKAGGIYLPLDPSHPVSRNEYILEDASSKILIDQSIVGAFIEEQSMFSDSNPIVSVDSTKLAYLIYTSGSTGQPKGCMIEHSGVVNMVHTLSKRFEMKEEDRVLQSSNIAFDASVEQIFLALLNGGALVVPGTDILMNPAHLSMFIDDKGVTHIDTSPALLGAMKFKKFSALNRIIVGGDVCPLSLAKKWGKDYDFYNEYGPTETTVTTLQYKYDPEHSFASMPIGYPIGNTTVYLLDKDLNLCPLGVPGEIHLGGAGLGRGYLNRPELTTASFIAHPFIEGERLYKTGDIGKWLPEGPLAFIGRKDDQVKIRGYRIEIGELENKLLSLPAIAACVVLADKTKFGDPRLVAYWVETTGYNDQNEISDQLAALLPEYMIPSHFVKLDELPLNANGKIDRKKLSSLQVEQQAVTPYLAPSNDTERALTKIWEELLLTEPIGVNDNFFELGGHSILSMKLIARIRDKFEFNLNFKELIKKPTIRNLSLIINRGVVDKGLLIPLNRYVEDQPTVFMIPPILGSSVIFYPLASLFEQNDINCYGFQYRGFDHAEPFDESIVKMANSFREGLKTLDFIEHQTINIMGYSMGATIGYELVRLLEQEGLKCRLVLIDRGVSSLKSSISEKVRKTIYGRNDLDKVIKLHLGENKITFNSKEKERIEQLIVHSDRILSKHRMNEKIKADILAIEAERSNFKSRMKNWQSHTEGELVHRYLLSDHFEVLNKEYITDIVDFVKRFISSTEELKNYEAGEVLTFFNLFQNRSKLFFPFLGLLGIINGVWGSALLILINNKITDTPLPFYNEYDWGVYIFLIAVSFLIAASFQTYMIKLSYNFGNEMGLSIFNKIRFTDYEDYVKLGEERMRTALIDVAALQRFPGSFLESFNATVMVMIGIGYLFWVDVIGAAFVSIIMIILASIYIFRNKRIEKDLDMARELGNVYEKNVLDFVRGFKEVKMSIKRSDNIFIKYITENRSKFVNLQVGSMIRALQNELVGSYAWYVMIGIVLFLLPAFFGLDVDVRTNFLVTLLFLMGPVSTVIGLMDEFIRMRIAINRLNKFNEVVNSSVSVKRGHGLALETGDSFSGLKFRGITYEYYDLQKSATFKLAPVDLDIKRGECIFVTGGNGSGKSTFINILAGLYRPKGGEMFFDGQKITDDNRPNYRNQLSCIFTDTYLFSENYDELQLDSGNKELVHLLKMMKLNGIVNYDSENDRLSHHLSKGQQKRLALIYSILADKDILIFDEWAAEQDPDFRRYFYRFIIPELKKMGKTVIAVTHDDLYFDCAERLIKFDYGKIVKDIKIDENYNNEF